MRHTLSCQSFLVHAMTQYPISVQELGQQKFCVTSPLSLKVNLK